jgi:hypothetical protein
LLEKEGKIIGKLDFAEERDLSEKLLRSIDALLKENKVNQKHIEKIELQSDIGEPYTTYRIAKMVAETFNWSVKKA